MYVGLFSPVEFGHVRGVANPSGAGFSLRTGFQPD